MVVDPPMGFRPNKEGVWYCARIRLVKWNAVRLKSLEGT